MVNVTDIDESVTISRTNQTVAGREARKSVSRISEETV